MSITSGIRSLRKLAFKEYNENSKCIISKELRTTFGFLELIHATHISLRSAGKRDVTELFIGALDTMPSRALRLRIVWAAHTNYVV
jgi:hypothetical protein